MLLTSPCELVCPFSGQVRRPEVALTIPAAVPVFFAAQMLAWLSAALGPADHFAAMRVPVQHTKMLICRLTVWYAAQRQPIPGTSRIIALRVHAEEPLPL